MSKDHSRFKTAMGHARVRDFLLILSSRLTQYDAKLQVKQPNNYRLGLFLKALEKVETQLRGVLNEDTPEAMELLKRALSQHFTNLPPVNAVVKLIDTWVSRGKLPRYGSSSKVADKESFQQRKGTNNMRTKKANPQIGKTIIEQMGGSLAMRMIGATKVIWLSDGVGVLWPNKQRTRGNYFEVHLTPEDEYDLEFYNVSRGGKKLVRSYNGVYWDQLAKLFEQQTGWRLRFASHTRSSSCPDNFDEDACEKWEANTKQAKKNVLRRRIDAVQNEIRSLQAELLTRMGSKSRSVNR